MNFVTIAKNAAWLISGQTIGRILRAALVIFAARVLGPESWGAFSYIMSLAAFLIIFSDIGVSAIVTRESAKNLDQSAQYFSTAFFIKIFLLVLGAAILIFGAPYLAKIEEAKMLMPLVAILLIFDSLRNFGFAVSRAMEKMKWEAINEIATNVFIVAFGFYALFLKPDSAALTWAYIGGTFAGFLMIVYFLAPYFRKILTHFNFALIKPILSASFPFALASFLGAIMINTDLVMLGWLRTPAEVGFYSAAQKPIQLLYVLASLFATSLFPTLSKLAGQAKEQFRDLLKKALAAALAFTAPLTIGGLILAEPIIKLLFGQEYLAATPSFQILLFTLVIIFPSVIISNSLLAYNQQKKFIWFSALGALSNVAFNFLLIPTLGIAGCALSTLITLLIANAFIWREMYLLLK